MKKRKNIIVISLILSILIMSVGYSTLATELRINGSAEITGVWDIKITNIEVESKSDGVETETPTFTDTSASFNAKLNKPGDYVIYKVTVANKGTIDAILSNVLFIGEEDGSSAILYETTNLKNELLSGETTTFNITTTYDENVKEVPENKSKKYLGIIEYDQL